MLWSHSTHERIQRSWTAPAKYCYYEQSIIIRNTCCWIKISVLSQCLLSLAAYHPKPTKSCLEWRKWLDRAGPLCCFGFLYRLLTTPFTHLVVSPHSRDKITSTHPKMTLGCSFMRCGEGAGEKKKIDQQIILNVKRLHSRHSWLSPNSTGMCINCSFYNCTIGRDNFLMIYRFRPTHRPKAPQSRRQRTLVTAAVLASSECWAAAGFWRRRDCWLQHLHNQIGGHGEVINGKI